MTARFEAYPPDRASLVRFLEPGRIYRVGRNSACELRIDHDSISRFHAELQDDARGWHLSDTGSKNGLRVDGHLVLQAHLTDSIWFAIGDVYCHFEPLSPEQVHELRSQHNTRRSISRALSSRLSPDLGFEPLLAQTLDAMLELSGLGRGFVLYGESVDALRVRASRGIDLDELARSSFAGSVGAVDRALRERRSVVCGDTGDTPWLGVRPSVQLGGIRALICVPLLHDGELLGAVYADSRRPGTPLTELDQELIESIAGHAVATLAMARLRDAVDSLLQASSAAGARAPRWQEIRSACRMA
ncbi:GAF domain-containing protein [Dokdonella soli]|uniref:FHA domain-containing protein n=1 Tax=Dokdonella soli TaxID=529810 RepID=A0ABN1IH42_9GAMM